MSDVWFSSSPGMLSENAAVFDVPSVISPIDPRSFARNTPSALHGDPYSLGTPLG